MVNRILIIDDEPRICRLLTMSLTNRGYSVRTAATGREGLTMACDSPHEIVLLDLGLPDMEGVEVCRELRRRSDVPIIILSVRGGERDKVAALDAGADDYLTKPFGMEELLARTRANLRRRATSRVEGEIVLGELSIDFGRRIVRMRGALTHLTPSEYALLRSLASNAGRVVTHAQLLRELRGGSLDQDTAVLRVHMAALRQKLAVPAGRPGHIMTEPGVGYRLLEGVPN